MYRHLFVEVIKKLYVIILCFSFIGFYWLKIKVKRKQLSIMVLSLEL